MGKNKKLKAEDPLARLLSAAQEYMFVDILKSPQQWEAFARPIKTANIKRPAFQEEMASGVPGWKDLG